ncbi:uncharacterized protein KQ657_004078 [Scheffersomyces spartinae]|uniref:NDT80 domain-containing protein n=1 Tax=Scheffersomyces spartinae TaxID=45513 RepID=A0A9P7VBQ2_9ASCO|nr:uncharacterized protein KQ657_004078 [Scheffersomyces spartinae]KAG7194967.1 hypothetical protein KQ657_004078 [Scheffersomyces spartinae]
MAPRSQAQFKIGPPFGQTLLFQRAYQCSTNQEIVPTISARIDRGFNTINNQWVGYKRNYFTLTASFQLSKLPHNIIETEQFYVMDSTTKKRSLVKYFWINIGARCLTDNHPVYLIQHSAKRDKTSKLYPQSYLVVPGMLPQHEVIKLVANLRNSLKINEFKHTFHYVPTHTQINDSSQSTLSTYPKNQDIFVCAKYERVQFSTAPTSQNQRNSMSNRMFALNVLLFAAIEGGDSVLIAKSETGPLVIRGRSPSTYKDRKRGDFKPLCLEAARVELNTENEEIRKEHKLTLGINRKPLPLGNEFKPTGLIVEEKCINRLNKGKGGFSNKSDALLQNSVSKFGSPNSKPKKISTSKDLLPVELKGHSKLYSSPSITQSVLGRSRKSKKSRPLWFYPSSDYDNDILESDWLLEATCPTSELDDFIHPSCYGNSNNADEYPVYASNYLLHNLMEANKNNSSSIAVFWDDNIMSSLVSRDDNLLSEYLVLSRGSSNSEYGK